MTEDTKITDANDMRLVIGTRQAGGPDGSLVVADFEFDVSQEKSLRFGVGNEDAQGRTHGNKEITFSFTLEGEDADIFNEIADSSTSMDSILTGNDYKWRVKDLDWTNFNFSGSDGSDPVEFSCDMNALDYETETLV